jgi:hypothetical protein
MRQFLIALCLGIVFVVVYILLLLIFAYPFMLLWNYAVVAAISVAKPIGYWVSCCLMIFISFFMIGSKNGSAKSS